MPTHRPLPVGTSDCFYQLNLSGDLDPMYLTFGMQFTNPPNAATATGLFNNFLASVLPTFHSSYQLVRVHILYQSDSAHQLAYDSTPSPAQGLSTDTPAPQNVAYLVKKQTGFAGRRYRGRTYVPGVSEANIGVSGILLPGFVTGVQNAWNAVLTYWNSVGNPVLIHSTQFTEPEPPVTPPAPTRITGLLVDPLVATQRRRLRR